MEYNLLLVLLVVISVSLIALILIQHGKGADAGAAFGSGASGTVFGSKGATSFLGKLTSGLAVAFFIVCILLAYLIGHQHRGTGDAGGSIVDQLEDNPVVPAIPEVAPEIPVAPTEVQPADIPQAQELAPVVEPEAATIPDLPVEGAADIPVDASPVDNIPVPEVPESATNIVDDAAQQLETSVTDGAAEVMDKAESGAAVVTEPVMDKVESVIDDAEQITPDPSSSELNEVIDEQVQTTN